MSERKPVGTRQDYKYFVPITTRWHDNDVYGHVNNVTYYSYFDSIANHYLIHVGGLDIHRDDTIGLVVNSGCSYHAALAFPDELDGGLRINRLGTSSVEYGLAIFRKGDDIAAAEGHFVHVFVDRTSRRPTAIPTAIRDAFMRILANDQTLAR